MLAVGEMILLSNLIKAKYTNEDSSKKTIQYRTLTLLHSFDHKTQETPDMLEIHHQADEIIAKAKRDAETMLLKAKEESQKQLLKIEEAKQLWEIEKEQLIEETKKTGYEAGIQAGKQDGYLQYSEQLNLAKEIVMKAKNEANEYIEASEKTVLQLALKVAEQILKTKLEETPEQFLSLIKHVLKDAKEYHQIQLFVHPSKYELVSRNKDELLAMCNREKNMLIYPDDELSETSCVLESSFGRIDASIDSQLSELKSKLLDLLEEENS